MKIPYLFTLFFAALSLTSATATHGEEIYRCGNSYSQMPCAQGKVLNIDDSRDAARKKEVDAATRRDNQLANQLEHERLLQEQAHIHKPTKQNGAKTAKVPTAPVPDQTTTLTPKRPKRVLHKHKDFTALIPGSDQKSSVKKKPTQPKAAASK
ncbi:MAG: hypothetical protein GW848_02885 [Rhodoferax sp.]|nr:hypothetical protein [Rhodoferax sp.]NCP54633.1 hypothetical protein [Rhodoferax sp.]OIP19759.1 MAG: hypothetical protein AUK52_11955 [Comamonadaceae bacterium CG2_30_60_41]PIW07366.1 MAG: hypothetical protein COW39_13670 [Comamonadaceae bacterium CG17_big_fil_post_rev_8_21_14_2_50_60_13]PIY26337.1 MAG: hypothetical protein COZ10_02790 [Comamonadaceae bacterium CG_4_10_14_3_um_filter_60_75]